MKELELPIIRFEFTTPLHIGNERSDYAKGSAYLHSDTITSAIYFAWVQLGKAEWIPSSKGDSSFVLSSLFPFSQDNESKERIYFLPRPMLRLKNEESEELSTKLRKQLKGIQYVDHHIFSKMLLGKPVSASEGNVSGKFRSLAKLPDKIIQSHIIPRAAVSRSGQDDTTIFYMERHYFSDNSGLYTLAHYDNAEVENRVKIAIDFLSDEGLGTDRNIGNGKFKAHYEDSLKFICPVEPEYGINLSLFCPSSKTELEGMLKGEQVGYNLIRRGGWLSEPYNTWRKKSVYMLTEGSVFNLKDKIEQGMATILGKTEDIKPDGVNPPMQHPVWRSGRSIFIPF